MQSSACFYFLAIFLENLVPCAVTGPQRGSQESNVTSEGAHSQEHRASQCGLPGCHPETAGACEDRWLRGLVAAHVPCVMAGKQSLHLPLDHNPTERAEKNPEMIEIKLLQFLGRLGVQNRNVKN